MLAGSTLVALCLLTLGWAPELVNAFIDDNPKVSRHKHAIKLNSL